MAEVHRQIQVQLEDVVSRRKTGWFAAKTFGFAYAFFLTKVTSFNMQYDIDK